MFQPIRFRYKRNGLIFYTYLENTDLGLYTHVIRSRTTQSSFAISVILTDDAPLAGHKYNRFPLNKWEVTGRMCFQGHRDRYASV